MDGGIPLILIVTSVGVLVLVLVLLLILRRCFCPKRVENSAVPGEKRVESIQNGITRLHQMNLDGDGSRKTNYHFFRNGVSRRNPFFNWADHPSLIIDAVENGWSRFAFRNIPSSPSVMPERPISGFYTAAGDQRNGADVEIDWEVCEGSADFMQKIRLNPGFSLMATALPLPGPRVGNSSFPQEAYFEITIVSRDQNAHDHLGGEEKDKEYERIKLIGEDFNSKMNQDFSGRVPCSDHRRRSSVDKVKHGRKNEAIVMSVGLTGGSILPLKVPGTYPGSVGFNSNGSVYLDGIKIMMDSEEDNWRRAEKVIGCGYNPSKKKVFFTVDSQLVHEIRCKTEEFGYPLYPTLAANTEIMVLVNFGQSPFKFMPANSQRTANPCFMEPLLENPHSGGIEDSGELFSIGRIDPQWLRRSAARSNNSTVNSIRTLEYDQESEGELFEIVLDSTGRSPYASHQ